MWLFLGNSGWLAMLEKEGKTVMKKAMKRAGVLAAVIAAGAALVVSADTADKIHIRDPFVVVDKEKGCYCLLSS